jgi:hypothetical protein
MFRTTATFARQCLKQAPILTSALIIAGVFGITEHDRVSAEWREIFPTERREATALQLCYAENHQFNRMSDQARKGCYDKWLVTLR